MLYDLEVIQHVSNQLFSLASRDQHQPSSQSQRILVSNQLFSLASRDLLVMR